MNKTKPLCVIHLSFHFPALHRLKCPLVLSISQLNNEQQADTLKSHHLAKQVPGQRES